MNFFVSALLPGSYARHTKCLCLVYSEENKLDAVPDNECVSYDAALCKSGQCLALEAHMFQRDGR
ncbi:MAG TPA: hypothetical protein VES91_10610 [Burkholderiaceae bacterium]|nr:hypothetical protein [Burkholderiaceae bacterium]